MSASILPDKARPLAPQPWLIPSMYLLCISGSLIPEGIVRSASVTLGLMYLALRIPKYTLGEVPQDYLFPIQALQAILHWIDFYVIHSPDDFSRAKDGTSPPPPKTAWGKLKQAWDLNTTMRGIGWNWQVKNIPEAASEGTTNWQFAGKEFMKAGIFYFMFDFCSSTMKNSAYGSTPAPDLFSDTLARRTIFDWLPAISSYYSMNMQYSLFAALTVICGLYTPQDWPPLMGRLKDVSSVRDFWGRFWHQLLRRKLTLPYNFLTSFVPIKHGTFISRYLQLFLAFFASAAIHHVGALNLPNSTVQNNRYQLLFFLSQPVAILFEDLVIYLGEQAGIKSSWKTKLLGKAWTMVWFSLILVPMSAFHYNAGFMEKAVLPSIITLALSIAGKVSRRGAAKSEL
ncbi:hypothetical protein G7Y89_g4360 [Cudoniella acicularis]|uniref:Wax synthase domain-containing protein n=1 Tax=Cudoniella acicularis TaxID=354080 RepID=A0A8H4RSL4_9HELO|nr:hypothetical protein G7Y89_g4360 [Cudoniella acicularis]